VKQKVKFVVNWKLFSCLEFCEESLVSTGCEECKKKYCENCFKALHVPKKLQNHISTPILKLKTQFCSNHPKEYAGYFCFQDQSFICSSCTISKHKDHQPVELKDAINTILLEIQSFDVSHHLKSLKLSIQNVDETISKEETFYENEKMKLEKLMKEMKLNSEEKLENLKMTKKQLQDSQFLFENFQKNLDSENTLRGLLKLKQDFSLSNFVNFPFDAKEQLKLALCYKNGDGVSKDLKKAIELFTLAANQGDSNAQYHLGFCFLNGDGVQKDFHKAIEFYRLAADQKHSTAKNNLGYCYENGLGVKKDLNKAFELYSIAADQGDPIAQYNLALCYKNGKLFFESDQGINLEFGKLKILIFIPSSQFQTFDFQKKSDKIPLPQKG
jgi:hypothetical protein